MNGRNYDGQAAGLFLITGLAAILAALVLAVTGDWAAAAVCTTVVFAAAGGLLLIDSRARRQQRSADQVTPWTADPDVLAVVADPDQDTLEAFKRAGHDLTHDKG